MINVSNQKWHKLLLFLLTAGLCLGLLGINSQGLSVTAMVLATLGLVINT